MKIKCLIVDDEPLALDLLESHIRMVDELELVGRYQSAVESASFLRQQPVDLLFLDIQMPVLTGIDFIKTLPGKPKIIITTAYKKYAYDAFELDVEDYLLKPITFERFLKAINKVFRNTYFKTEAQPRQSDPFEEAFIYLKADRRSVKVVLSDILFIESIRDYVKVVTPEATLIAHIRISALEEKLPKHTFLRIHRSFIIARNRVHSFTPKQVEIRERFLPIGRLYKEKTLEVLGEKLIG